MADLRSIRAAFGVGFTFLASGLVAAPVTELGVVGNEFVTDTFKQYQRESRHCEIRTDQKRVMITGFGAFFDRSTNISTRVLDFLSDESFEYADEQAGGRIWQGQLALDGESISACFIHLEVVWDLAPAIVIDELQRFRPHVVLLTGQGPHRNVVLEAAALNSTSHVAGYLEGKRLDINVPLGPNILMTAVRQLSFNWHRSRLKSSLKELMRDLGVQVALPQRARSLNNYVCNNLSFAVLHALQFGSVRLAGGRLEQRYDNPPKTQVGFMHYPAHARVSQVDLWGQVVRRIVTSELDFLRHAD